MIYRKLLLRYFAQFRAQILTLFYQQQQHSEWLNSKKILFKYFGQIQGHFPIWSHTVRSKDKSIIYSNILFKSLAELDEMVYCLLYVWEWVKKWTSPIKFLLENFVKSETSLWTEMDERRSHEKWENEKKILCKYSLQFERGPYDLILSLMSVQYATDSK